MEPSRSLGSKIFFFFLILSLSLIILDHFSLLGLIRSPIENILIKAQSSLYSNRLKMVKSFSPQVEETKNKDRKIADLENQILILKKENSDMQKLLGCPLPKNWKFTPAKILGEENGILLIDKGKDDKVGEGKIVIFENVFVGRVISLTEHTSKVETPKNPKFKMRVVIKSPSLDEVKANGLLVFSAERLFVEQILPEETITQGDLVLTSSPADLLIGKITKVEPDKSGIFQKGTVELSLSYFDLENVFLLDF